MNPVDGLLFGTGGVPDSAPDRDTVSALRFLRGIGLDSLELEFVRGTFPGEAKSREIAETARETGIRLTAHGPYFINLNSAEPEKVVSSRARIFKTAQVGTLCGAESITFHPAYLHQDDPETVYGRVREELALTMEEIDRAGFPVDVRPETTGKPSQFGSVDEIVRLSRDIGGVHPCVDWSHLHARTGACNSAEEFRSVLGAIRDGLGEQELRRIHMHVSGIEYGSSGEKKHLDLEDSDFNWRDLISVLKDNGVSGFVVCESPHREDDARRMKDWYGKI
ncbi:MAG: TIM barrel protein [Candidatus Latescibacterota bacterium]